MHHFAHSFHLRYKPKKSLATWGASSLASQRTRHQGSIYKSFLKLFYVCLGWGNSSIVVHIVIGSLRCVEDMEFFGQMIWSTMVLIVIINCSLLLLTDRKHIFWDVSCRSIVHDSFVHVGSTGPVFDEDGQVLTHTILGSWEDFQQEAIKRGDIEVFCV